MSFVEQNIKLPVTNFDKIVEREKGDLVSDTISAVFCGPSNCGKINILLALIMHPNGVGFTNIYVYSKSLKQPKHKFLKQSLEPLDEIQYFSFSEHEAVIPPDKALPDSLMIFDDITCEKRDNVKSIVLHGTPRARRLFLLVSIVCASSKAFSKRQRQSLGNI